MGVRMYIPVRPLYIRYIPICRILRYLKMIFLSQKYHVLPCTNAPSYLDVDLRARTTGNRLKGIDPSRTLQQTLFSPNFSDLKSTCPQTCQLPQFNGNFFPEETQREKNRNNFGGSSNSPEIFRGPNVQKGSHQNPGNIPLSYFL